MKTVRYKDSLITPSKIVCVGRNYVEHIYELNNEIPSSMVIFNKPNSAISDELRYFKDTRFEGELSFLVIDKKIAAIGVGLDLTKVAIQNELKQKGLPWEKAKAFDGSAVFSEFIELRWDLSKIYFKLFVNQKLRQQSSYELMIYKPDEILKEIESFMSLEDGDIIMSGTPKGVGEYKIGDEFKVELYYSDSLILTKKWSVI